VITQCNYRQIYVIIMDNLGGDILVNGNFPKKNLKKSNSFMLQTILNNLP